MVVYSVFDSSYPVREYIGYVEAGDKEAAEEVVKLVYKRFLEPKILEELKRAREEGTLTQDQYEIELAQTTPNNYVDNNIRFQKGIVSPKHWEANWLGNLNVMAVICDNCLKKLKQLYTECLYEW